MTTSVQESVENKVAGRKPGDKVVISNSMARKYWNPSSVYEGRILTYVASLIKPTDSCFHTYEIPISEIVERSCVKYSGDTYKIVKKAIIHLTGRTIALEEGRKIEVYSIFARCAYDGVTKKIEISFNELLRDHFLSLTKNFTQCALSEFMVLPTVPSQNLYQYLKSFVNTHPSIDVDIETLHKILGSPKTQRSNYAEFKRRTLAECHTTINNNTYLKYEYEAIRKKQKVVAVKFTISSKNIKSINKVPDNNLNTTLKDLFPPTIERDLQVEKNKISAKASKCLRDHNGDNSMCTDIDNDVCQRCINLRRNSN